MVYSITMKDGSSSYLVPNNRIPPNSKPEGIRLLSGVLVSDASVIGKFLTPKDVKEAKELDFKLLDTVQDNDSGTRRWLRVSHRAYSDFLDYIEPVESEHTKMSPSNVYLADADAENYLEALDSKGIDYKINRKDKPVKNSTINKFADFEFEKLLVSYYKGREFVNPDNGDVSTITDVLQTPSMTRVAFIIDRDGQQYSSVVRLDTFAARHIAVEQDSSVDSATVDVDMNRFIVTSEHILTPGETDQEYLDAIPNAIKEGQSMERMSPKAH